jgi:V/A-type H+-transporting ATPase subunit C
MGGSRHHTYLHTRVAVMAARLFKAGELKQLSALDAERLGKRYGLDAMLDDSLAVQTRNRAIERALISTLLSELSLLLRPMYGEARGLVLYWARKFELYNLKALVRGKLSGLDEQAIKDNLYDLPASLALPHASLLRSESLLELLRHLEQSPYRAIASQARHVYEERHESFILEATIDQGYCAGLAKRVRELHGTDLAQTQRIVASLLDQINLLWLLRYRFAYGLSASEAYYQLIPSSGQLHRGMLLKLVNLSSFEKVIAALPQPLARLLDGATSTIAVEHRMDTHTARLLTLLLRHSPSAVARALAYLILREQDLRRLFAVAQAKLLGLDGDVLDAAIGFHEPALLPEAVSA